MVVPELVKLAIKSEATRFRMLKVGFGSPRMAGVSGRCSHWLPMKNSVFVSTTLYWLGVRLLL